ncbi:MAG: hypothetical protein ACFN4S_06525, partial [Prevotella conceptionensis]
IGESLQVTLNNYRLTSLKVSLSSEVSIMQRQRHAAIYRRLSTCRKHTERLQPKPLVDVQPRFATYKWCSN